MRMHVEFLPEGNGLDEFEDFLQRSHYFVKQPQNDFGRASGNLAEGMAEGVAGRVAGGVAGGMAEGVAGRAAGGMAEGVAGGMAEGVAGRVAEVETGRVAEGLAGRVAGGMAGRVAGGTAGSVAGGTAGRVAGGTAGRVAGGTAGKFPSVRPNDRRSVCYTLLSPADVEFGQNLPVRRHWPQRTSNAAFARDPDGSSLGYQKLSEDEADVPTVLQTKSSQTKSSQTKSSQTKSSQTKSPSCSLKKSKRHKMDSANVSRRHAAPERARIRRPRELLLCDPSVTTTAAATTTPPRCHITPSMLLSPEFFDARFYRQRSFSTSGKAIVNRGDSIKRRAVSRSAPECLHCASPANVRDAALAYGDSAASEQSRVLMLGSSGVGKTSLAMQLVTSEYMGSCDTSSWDDQDERAVSVLLNGEETLLSFIDLPDDQDHVKYPDVAAYLLIYSVADQDSFDQAVRWLHQLSERENRQTVVVLVANKGDIVRNRIVDEKKGKETAILFGCKYSEVSAVLNLNVDELLVGVVSQLRFAARRRRLQHPVRGTSGGVFSPTSSSSSGSGGNSPFSPSGCMQRMARGFFGRFLGPTSGIDSRLMDTCDDLLVS